MTRINLYDVIPSDLVEVSTLRSAVHTFFL
jgi:hypothetical protein